MRSPSTFAQPFAGFTSPNYTQVPDELFDVLLPRLADNELRVLLYIIRRTFGFKREADSISLSQMVHGITTREGTVLDAGTGLSKSTVARGLKSLREQGIIVATRNASKDRGDQPTTYRLRFTADAAPAAPMTDPVSRQQDTPRVPAMGQAVSQPWDTQETDPQQTAFESSKDETRDRFGEEQGSGGDQTTSHPDRTASSFSEGSLGAILSHRVRRDVGRVDRQAIGVALTRIAAELGDRAETKLTLARTLNLYQAGGIGRDGFVDLLYQARGEVLDRYRHPGKAPVLRNRMAYFFAVVEDRLGLRTIAEGARDTHGS
jgi:DNA-binding transcriptional ArsR family regulator